MTENNVRKIELLMFSAAVLVLGMGLYYLGPSITGFIIREIGYSDDLNLVVTSSGNYTWHLSNIGELKSVKIDGRVTEYGKARAYIEDNGIRHLIFDSTSIGEEEIKQSNETNLITGFAVEENKDENKSESDEYKQKKNKKPVWIGFNEFAINGTTSINLSQYFTDGDALIYSASEVEGLEVTMNGEIATIKSISDKDFNTTITFIASDGVDSKSELADLIVYAIKPETIKLNRSPIWNSNIDTFIINGTATIDLSQYFTDEDNDTLSYTAGLAEGITININNNIVILVPAE